jgi:hypothetical protein
MSHSFKVNEGVHHQPQGPRGRVTVDQPRAYTIVQRMPVEADGLLRYRIKSDVDNIVLVVTEDQLSPSQ